MTMKKIKLFDYQEDMVKRVQEAFRHHDSVMVQMPTGTGKTMVLTNIVFSFLEKSNHPIWIVAHRRELVSQIKETIFSKITPSLFTLKEGSTAFPKPLSPQGTGDVTALRCSEPLRSKVGGPSKVSPDCLSAGALIKVTSIQWLSKHYRENGIKAVAISSQTPLAERQELIERFKAPLVIKAHKRRRWL